MENIEIEIQVKIEKSQQLVEFLNKNAKFKFEDHQIDEYFTPSHRDFTSVRPVDEWLRLRDSSGKIFITYKNWHRDENGKSTYCDEYELSIEDIGRMKKIFQALNFKNVAVVDKTRKSWDYENFEISMDSIKGLGDFVEVEYKGSGENIDPKKIVSEMIKFLKGIGCGKIERNHVGYPFQLLFPNEVKFEEQ